MGKIKLNNVLIVSMLIIFVVVIGYCVGTDFGFVSDDNIADATTFNSFIWNAYPGENNYLYVDVTFDMSDVALGTHEFIIWDLADTSGTNGRPKIIGKKDVYIKATTGTVSYTITIVCSAVTFVDENNITGGRNLAVGHYLTGNTQFCKETSPNDWPYITNACDFISPMARTSVTSGGNRVKQELFKICSKQVDTNEFMSKMIPSYNCCLISTNKNTSYYGSLLDACISAEEITGDSEGPTIKLLRNHSERLKMGNDMFDSDRCNNVKNLTFDLNGYTWNENTFDAFAIKTTFSGKLKIKFVDSKNGGKIYGDNLGLIMMGSNVDLELTIDDVDIANGDDSSYQTIYINVRSLKLTINNSKIEGRSFEGRPTYYGNGEYCDYPGAIYIDNANNSCEVSISNSVVVSNVALYCKTPADKTSIKLERTTFVYAGNDATLRSRHFAIGCFPKTDGSVPVEFKDQCYFPSTACVRNFSTGQDENLNEMANKFGKGVVIEETSYGLLYRICNAPKYDLRDGEGPKTLYELGYESPLDLMNPIRIDDLYKANKDIMQFNGWSTKIDDYECIDLTNLSANSELSTFGEGKTYYASWKNPKTNKIIVTKTLDLTSFTATSTSSYETYYGYYLYENKLHLNNFTLISYVDNSVTNKTAMLLPNKEISCLVGVNNNIICNVVGDSTVASAISIPNNVTFAKEPTVNNPSLIITHIDNSNNTKKGAIEIGSNSTNVTINDINLEIRVNTKDSSAIIGGSAFSVLTIGENANVLCKTIGVHSASNPIISLNSTFNIKGDLNIDNEFSYPNGKAGLSATKINLYQDSTYTFNSSVVSGYSILDGEIAFADYTQLIEGCDIDKVNQESHSLNQPSKIYNATSGNAINSIKQKSGVSKSSINLTTHYELVDTLNANALIQKSIKFNSLIPFIDKSGLKINLLCDYKEGQSIQIDDIGGAYSFDFDLCNHTLTLDDYAIKYDIEETSDLKYNIMNGNIEFIIHAINITSTEKSTEYTFSNVNFKGGDPGLNINRLVFAQNHNETVNGVLTFIDCESYDNISYVLYIDGDINVNIAGGKYEKLSGPNEYNLGLISVTKGFFKEKLESASICSRYTLLKTTEDDGVDPTIFVYKVEELESWISSGHYDTSWFNKTKTEYILTKPEELAGFSAICAGISDIKIEDFHYYDATSGTFDIKPIYIGADMDLGKYSWYPINNFYGYFYGNGHTIKNIKLTEVSCIYSSENDYYTCGFFSAINYEYGADIKDINIEASVDLSLLDGIYYIGGLVGTLDYTITENVSAHFTNVSIKGDAKTIYFGGLAGRIVGTDIYDSYAITDSISIDSLNCVTLYMNPISPIYNFTEVINMYGYAPIDYTKCIDHYFDYSGDANVIRIENVYTYNGDTFNYYNVNNGIKGSEIEEIRTDLDKEELCQILDETAYQFDEGKFDVEVSDSNVIFYHWQLVGDYPVFYKGSYFHFLETDRAIKSCDSNFNIYPEKEGYTFMGWTTEFDIYSSVVAKINDKYTLDMFDPLTNYYAFFKQNTTITDLAIDGWTYGEIPSVPTYKYNAGSPILTWRVKGETQSKAINLKDLSTFPDQAGTYVLKVTINGTDYYFGAEKEIEFTINKAKFNMNTIMISDATYVYDGEEKTINYQGQLPSVAKEGDTIVAQYRDDKHSLTNAGVLDIYVDFVYDTSNYEEVQPLHAVLTIEKATYDMDCVLFQDTTYSYVEGTTYSLVIDGELPEGVTVEYENNTVLCGPGGIELVQPNRHSQVATCRYIVADLDNYNDIAPETATLTITFLFDYDMSKVTFKSFSKQYDGIESELVIEGELPEGVTVEYTPNKLTKPGELLVTASFKGDEINYNPIKPKVAKLVITKLNFGFDDFSFENKTYVYDGEEKELVYEGKLPNGVTVEYQNNKLTNAGQILATIIFNADYEVYNYLEPRYAMLTIEKATYDMSKVSFKDATYIYDGIEHELVIEGELPEGVTVSYGLNKLTGNGSIEVVATFRGDVYNYNPIPQMIARLFINKATYDMSKVKFESKEYQYDKTAKKLTIEGELPEGVRVKYTQNVLNGVGVLKVTATFIGDKVNYKSIPDKTATLTITKGRFDMSNVRFENTTRVYNGESQTLLLSGNIPQDVTVKYTNNRLKNVGKVTTTATFEVDENYYYPIKAITAQFEIIKADIDISNIRFEDKTIGYNGEFQTIEIEGILPSGVTVVYENNSRKELGDNTATAKFVIEDDKNYNQIEPLYAKITILRAYYDVSNIKFEDKSYIFDGEEKELLISGDLPEGVSVQYSANKLTAAGELLVTATFIGDFINYYEIPDMLATLTIEKYTYDMSGIIFADKVVPYDGLEKKLTIIGELPEGVRVAYSKNTMTRAGELLVVATFSVRDTANYNPIDSMQASLIITRLTYDMTGIEFESATYTYDGSQKKITISGMLPDGVRVDYSRNYLTKAGSILVTASFTGDKENYYPISPMQATLTITKAVYNLEDVRFEDKTFLYDGNTHSLTTTGRLPNGVSVKYINGEHSEPGTYKVTAQIFGDTENFESEELYATMTIISTIIESNDDGRKSDIVVSADEGFTKEVKIDFEYTPTKDLDKQDFIMDYSQLISKKESIGSVYRIQLFTEDSNGNMVEIQPADCSTNGKIKVKLLIPTTLNLNKVKKVYHVHSENDIEEITIKASDVDENGYVTLELDKLSEFVFITDNPNYKRNIAITAGVIAGIVVVTIWLILSFLFFIWRKTNKGFKFLIPYFRFKSRVWFHSKWNNIEIRSQE